VSFTLSFILYYFALYLLYHVFLYGIRPFRLMPFVDAQFPTDDVARYPILEGLRVWSLHKETECRDEERPGVSR
jgi:hypothetical protein